MDSERTSGERAVAYWFSDGLPELLFGAAMTAAYGGAFVWRVYLRAAWVLTIGVAGLAFLMLLFWKHRQIIEFFKSRITYPRTGYVAPPTPDRGQKHGPILLFGPQGSGNTSSFPFVVVNAGVVVGSMVRLWGSGEPWSVFAGSLALAILLYAVGRTQAHSYGIVSLLPLVAAGALCSFVGLPQQANRVAPEVLCSLWLLARGVATLALYLLRHPKRAIPAGQAV